MVVASAGVPAWSPPPFDAGRSAFAVEVGDDVIGYRTAAVFALPGEPVDLRVLVEDDEAEFRVDGMHGDWSPDEATVWQGLAPDAPGVYPVVVADAASGESLTLNVIVMVPVSTVAAGRIEAYRIGAYPAPLRDLPAYVAPRGFVRVTPDLRAVALSPHFTLGQFLAKQTSGFPKFVVLRTSLILKLERLLERVNQSGRRVDGLHVMSGFRTPFYNRSLGNTPNSRHVYGDAADVFVDVDGNGVMDDLNRNGRSDRGDAEWLARLVDQIESEPGMTPGGVSPYPANRVHGPFVHMDARGTRARW